MHRAVPYASIPIMSVPPGTLALGTPQRDVVSYVQSSILGSGNDYSPGIGFFRSLVVPGAYNRILIIGDSKTQDQTSTDQGCSIGSILSEWDIPALPDGTPGWVGWAGGGLYSLAALSRLFVTTVSTHGWTLTASRAPGSVFAGTGAGNQNNPQNAADYSIALGSSRTGYAALTGSNNTPIGSPIVAMPSRSPLNSTSNYNQTCNAGDPFSQRQTHMRLIFTATGSNGPTDMVIRGMRQMPGTAVNQFNTNNSVVVSSSTIDLTGSGVKWFDADCGTGAGTPLVMLSNPAAPTGSSELRIHSTGTRVFRSQYGYPIRAGTSIASIATSGHTTQQMASVMGVTGYTTPDPLFSSANARQYIRAMCGGHLPGQLGPTHVIIYTGHNFPTAESTEIAAGTSATFEASLTALVTAVKAHCVALDGSSPKILLVGPEWYRQSLGANNAVSARVIARAIRRVAVAQDAAFIDLFERTWDGVTTSFGAYTGVGMAYMKGASINAQAGSGSGPVALAGDFVHNSVEGSDYIWRMVWEAGLEMDGLQTTVTTRLRRTDDPRPRIVRGIR